MNKPRFLKCVTFLVNTIKGSLSGLWQFFATEIPLKMITNAFYITVKTLFVFKIFRFLFWVFGHEEKGLKQKDKVNLKIYDVTAWLTNTCNKDNKIWSANSAPFFNKKTIFLWSFNFLKGRDFVNIFLNFSLFIFFL